MNATFSRSVMDYRQYFRFEVCVHAAGRSEKERGKKKREKRKMGVLKYFKHG